MLPLHDNLWPRLRFWFGFMCCPLLVWFCSGMAYMWYLHGLDAVVTYLQSLSRLMLAFCLLCSLTFLCSIPFFAGFGAAFFWHESVKLPSQEMFGFYSVIVTCLPVTVFIQSIYLFFIATCFALSIFLYCVGLWKGNKFWNSNRSQQWFGDFSDREERQEP